MKSRLLQSKSWNNQNDDQFESVRYAFRTSWKSFSKIAFMSAILLLFICYFLPNLIFLGFYWFMLFSVWALYRIKRSKKMQRLSAFQFPYEIWNAFSQAYPQIQGMEQRYIEEAFKDYLALHIVRNQDYAMPSHSVDALWHLLLEQFPVFYQNMCLEILGFELFHRSYEGRATQVEQAKQDRQLLATWGMSCVLYGVDLKNPSRIPLIFQIDQIVGWKSGSIFNMAMILSLYQHINRYQDDGLTCSSSNSSSFSTSEHSQSDTDSSNSNNSDSSSSSSCSSSSD